MKLFLSFILCACCFLFRSHAQKKIIDTSAYHNWKFLKSAYLTNDGKYINYTEANFNAGYEVVLNKIVKSVNDSWELKLGSGKRIFLDDDKCLLYEDSNKVNLYWLGTNKVERLNTQSYYIPNIPEKNYIFYQDLSTPGSLTIKNIRTGRRFVIENVGEIEEYFYFSSRNGLLAKMKFSERSKEYLHFKYIDLSKRTFFPVENGKQVLQYLCDTDNEIAAFIIQRDDTREITVLQAGKHGTKNVLKADQWLDRQHISSLSGFADQGQKLLFTTACSQDLLADNEHCKEVDLKILSYKEYPDKKRKASLEKSWVVSLRNGALTQYSKWGKCNTADDSMFIDSLSRFSFVSPDKKYMVYINNNEYWSYEVATGKKRNISKSAYNNWFKAEDKDDDFFLDNLGSVTAWIANEDAVIISDEFDIWKLSLRNEYPPFNITNGYGRRNKIKFYLLESDPNNVQQIVLRNKLILIAFDNKTKKNGFFSKENYTVRADPQLLTLDNAMYWLPVSPPSYNNVTTSLCKPRKAKNVDIYLVAKSTADSAQNYYITKDFKHFKRVTDNFPERHYNWLTTQLITWKTDEGDSLQGVLYKPENFDSTKKYPVIFYYYRKSSMNLNTFMIPQECPGCIIDIPGYVSNGYLVFTPDIHFRIGETGKSALSAVVSAAEKLSSLPFVNGKKMGIQGCSFSGFLTNYIVTHTSKFTAACSASGLFNFVSGYNSINGGQVKQQQFENGPYQMGCTLWDNPKIYIDNSAVFKADKLTTPFLIMHTTKDVTVPISNAMEFFLAAKRLEKKVWMLQYGNNQNHLVYGNEGKDFNVRMRQFFDHYLKDAPLPGWMAPMDSECLKKTSDRLSKF